MTSSPSPLAIVILAAGKGTRMKSDLHKVLHPIAGRPMLDHLLASAAELVPERQVVIAGHGREQLAAVLAGRAEIAVQEPQLGTAHAVLQAEPALAGFAGKVLVLYADVPFVRAETMRAMLERLDAPDAPAVVVLGFEPDDVLHYGRIIADGDRIAKMVEHKDASAAERAVRLCNSGLMAARSADLFALLARVGNDNAQGEYYLPDVVNIALADGRRCAVVVTDDPDEVAGINCRAELAEAEWRWQQRRRRRAMDEGASLVAPETVWFSWDTEIGRDVTVEPNVVFAPGVRIADGATIRAFCHLEGSRPLCPPAPRRGAGRQGQGRQFRRGEEGGAGQGRQGQPPQLHRRCRGGRGREHRRGHHHLQLRRLFQIQDRDRPARLHRQQFLADRAGEDRRGCDRRRRQRGFSRCRGWRVAAGARGATGQARLGGPVSRCDAEEEGGGEEGLI
jgi:NDP-sugar pyrophosphorylase family protein